jgi:cytochrome c-type biogenesis protein CcmH/NrfG
VRRRWRSSANLALSRNADAAQAFDHALQLSPGDAESRRALGIALVRQGDSTGAARAWRGLVAGTDDPELLVLMRESFKKTKDRASADSTRQSLYQLKHPAR